MDKMKKVGICTVHRTINYGSFLQAYALQTSIDKLGGKCEIIDYHNDYTVNWYEDLTWRKWINPIGFIKIILHGRSLKKKIRRFKEFQDTYFHMSQRAYKKRELHEIDQNEYDAFICGSDQIWNYKITGFDETFLLDFVEDGEKKNAYAPSFGLEHISEEYWNKYKEHLATFNRLSVRESKGSEIIHKMIGREVPVLLDPTLLLTGEEWKKRMRSGNKRKEPYILVYAFGRDTELYKIAERLCEQTNCKVLCIDEALRKRIRGDYCRGVGPGQFLDLFYHADYIVTNSFHGSAFSICFHKKFYTKIADSLSETGSRMYSLMSLTGLESRLIDTWEQVNIDSEINWKDVDQKLEKKRKESMAFLNEIAGGKCE